MIDPNTLDPDVRSWLARDTELQRQLPSPPEGDLAALRLRDRQISDALANEFALAVDSRIEITDCEIAGVSVRRYQPKGSRDSLPTQVFLHGGGFISGSPWELVNDSTNALRAAQCGLQILSVDYRLAPEYPFPAAVHDLLAVLDALWEDPHHWSAAPEWLGLGGVSAGAQIALVATLLLRDRLRQGASVPHPVHLLLEVPPADLSLDWPSWQEFATDTERRAAPELVALYRGQTPLADATEAYFSPVRVTDLGGLPRTLVMTAELDPLRDAAEALVSRLAEAGVDAHGRRGIGQLHGTSGFARKIATSRAWQQSAISELRTALATSSTPGGVR